MFVQTPGEAITPTDQDTRIARTSSQALAPLLQESEGGEAHLRISTEGDRETEITLPHSAVRVLFSALQEMAKGRSVTLLPVDTELTTNQAAELMRISRPSLIKMLDERKLPYRKVGAHRRVRYEDVLRYLETERARRKQVMEELVAETERLGLYK
jgi:excisionase family DNA binding protein